MIEDRLWNPSTGSSPRGRGTPIREYDAEVQARFIPAWAGNTYDNCSRLVAKTVHPRVGGEHIFAGRHLLTLSGSSPRGRGTRNPLRPRRRSWRFIPAWAGNTGPPPSFGQPRPVHPRVGGEHIPIADVAKFSAGSSPRGRGTLKARELIRERRPVHPRVGGEHAYTCGLSILEIGSSPRGRGTLARKKLTQPYCRFIPAWAGNTDQRFGCYCQSSVHPRVGGEHRPLRVRIQLVNGSSPRGRGTRTTTKTGFRSGRFIPAWAGNTPRLRSLPIL